MSVTFQQMRTLSCSVREAFRESTPETSSAKCQAGPASLLMEDGAFASSSPIDCTFLPVTLSQVSLENSTPTLPPKKPRKQSDIVASPTTTNTANTAGAFEKVSLSPRVQSTLDLLRTEGVRNTPLKINSSCLMFCNLVCFRYGGQTS